MKSILNWHSSGAPSRLFHNGILYTKSQEIADTQNEYFLNKIKETKEENSVTNPNTFSHVRAKMADKSCSMELISVHPEEVYEIISNLSNSASYGLDEIDTYILKLLKDELTPAVTHIVNLSLKHGEFPRKWKDIKVIPIHKKMMSLVQKIIGP